MAVASQVSGLTSSWPLFLRASSLLSSSPLELHPLSVYEISFIVLFHIAEIASLVKFFFSFCLPRLGSSTSLSPSRSIHRSVGIKTLAIFRKPSADFSEFHHNEKLCSNLSLTILEQLVFQCIALAFCD